MSGREDTRLIERLYGELSEQDARELERALEEDPALAAEAESFESTLGLMRRHEDEEPSPHLDSLILAHAREEATKLEASGQGVRGFLRKMFRSPSTGLLVAGSLAAVIAVVVIPPALLMRNSSPPAEVMARDIPAAAPSVVEQKSAERAFEYQDGLARQDEDRGGDRGEALGKVAPMTPPSEDVGFAPPGNAERKARAAATREEMKAKVEPRKPTVSQPAKEAALEEPPPPPPRPMDKAKGDADAAPKREPAKKLEAAKQEAPRDEVAMNEKSATADRASSNAGTAKDSKRADEPAPVTATTESEALSNDDAADFSATKKVPAQTTAPAGGLAGPTMFDANVYAADVIRAAEAQLAQKDSIGARRILINAMQRTNNTPAHGELALRVAQLDYAEGRFEDAARYARVAANVPGFAKRTQAAALANQALASSNETRAKRAAPAKADEAAPAAAEDAR